MGLKFPDSEYIQRGMLTPAQRDQLMNTLLTHDQLTTMYETATRMLHQQQCTAAEHLDNNDLADCIQARYADAANLIDHALYAAFVRDPLEKAV